MTDEQQQLFEQQLKEQLEKARLQGLSVGAKTFTKIIYDKTASVTKQSSKNDLLRVLKDIRTFCETALSKKDSE
jgi:DNA topoisomerase VI subunit A